MTTELLFERDPYATECTAEVIGSGEDEGRPFVVLSDTVLFPEGGGQPADHGWLHDVQVIDAQRRADQVRHYLSRPVTARQVRVRLDWARRFDHMQQHTGQHVLTAVAEDRFGWPTTAFHLGEAVSDVELKIASLTAEQLAALEEEIAAQIRAARPVTVRRVSPESFATLPRVRTRGLPEAHSGDVRLVEIDGVDLNTCGGTHVRSTSEIEALKLLASEPMRGGTRVYFVAGGRVRRRIAAHEARNSELRTLLGVPDAEITAAVAGRLEDQRQLEKRLRVAERELAESLAAGLAHHPGPIVEAHLEDRELPFLQRVGRAFATAAPGSLLFLTGGHEGQVCFLLVAGEACPIDVQETGRQVAACLGGRGGGSARSYQGKTGDLAGRGAAIEVLTRAGTSP